MLSLLLLSFSSALLYGLAASLFFLGLSLYLLLDAAAFEVNFPNSIVLGAVCLAPFFSALIASALCERFCFDRFQVKTLVLLGALLFWLTSFSTTFYLDFLNLAMLQSQSAHAATALKLLTSLAGSVLFCGGLSAAAFMLFSLGLEFPFALLSKRSCIALNLALLRPLALLIFISLSLTLISGLFQAELWPDRILKGLRP